MFCICFGGAAISIDVLDDSASTNNLNNETVNRLRESCINRNKEIRRLRVAANRLKLRTNSLKELLNDLKQEKLISEEAEKVLIVRV